MRKLRLGINIDHVATLRNARGGVHPDPLRAARLVAIAGADQITMHLREDRRHIRDHDLAAVIADEVLPVNMEMAATDEMLAIALRLRPAAVCIVPERREELTTEGGLDVRAQAARLVPYVGRLREAGMRVSLFIDPDLAQVEASAAIGASAFEIHTGRYCHGADGDAELAAIARAAEAGHALGLEVHAGHGLDYDNVGPIAAISEIEELNIGHHLMGEALFVGLEAAIRRMRHAMDLARKGRSAS